MKKLFLTVGLLGISVTICAKPLTQTEFKAQVKQHYDALELKQALLNISVDQREHPSLMIAKACDYASGLKQLKQLSEHNQHLPEAREELQFISSLDNGFNQSLQELGTTYETGCLKK